MTEDKKDPIERMVSAYERMMERIGDMAETTETKTLPLIREAIAEAKEKAVELGELTREEADKISEYVERDLHDAADFIAETGQDFRDWFRFDWQLIEDRFFNLFASAADKTSLALRGLAEQAREASLYHTGEITGPGTLICVNCDKELHFKKTGHIPPCPECTGTLFKRVAHTSTPNTEDENLDQGEVDGD